MKVMITPGSQILKSGACRHGICTALVFGSWYQKLGMNLRAVKVREGSASGSGYPCSMKNRIVFEVEVLKNDFTRAVGTYNRTPASGIRRKRVLESEHPFLRGWAELGSRS